MIINPAIAVHLAAVLPALVLGLAVMNTRKGTSPHRYAGRAWAILMAIGALSSFWIQSSGHFSWIHVLSVVVLVVLARAVYAIRRKNVLAHRRAMQGAFAGLVIAGVVAVVPGRLLGTLLFG